MKLITLSLLFSGVLLFAVGCAPGAAGDEEERTGEAVAALVRENGEQMNGTHLNGTHLNGTHLNGISVNGTHLNGTHLNGTEITGTYEDTGVTISGAALSGADMQATLEDSSNVSVHISSISSSDVPGMLTYEITSGGANICGSIGAKALVVAGRWDYATGDFIEDSEEFTIACRGAGIAKCEEWGYARDEQWTEINGGSGHAVSMSYFHDACLRMVRGDYCGDGQYHTVTGTPIDVWDTASIQTQAPNSGMDFEAEWSPSGATCVKHTRWATVDSTDTYRYIQDHCPSLWAPTSTSCGADASGGSPFFAQNFPSNQYDDAHLSTRPLLRNESAQH